MVKLLRGLANKLGRLDYLVAMDAMESAGATREVCEAAWTEVCGVPAKRVCEVCKKSGGTYAYEGKYKHPECFRKERL